jgi:hypothetical protein
MNHCVLHKVQRAEDTTLPEDVRKEWWKKAEATYIQALQIDPFYIAACFNYGNLLQNAVRY